MFGCDAFEYVFYLHSIVLASSKMILPFFQHSTPQNDIILLQEWREEAGEVEEVGEKNLSGEYRDLQLVHFFSLW